MTEQQNADNSTHFQDRHFYEMLLAYADSELAAWDDKLPSIVAYLLRDGSIRFSAASPVGVLEDAIAESRLSDRLLVVVSVAYLDDQIRLLLAKFLTNDEETSKLLDPENGSLAMLQATRLAFSSGLIAKEWFEILKEMGRLRNRFAHDPSAQSFEDLLTKKPKDTRKSLNRIFELYSRITQQELKGTTHWNFGWVFMFIYAMLQYSIDYLATSQAIHNFDAGEIIDTSYVEGLTRETIQRMLDDNFSTV